MTAMLLPHGYCLEWEPTLVWSLVVSNALIAAAYYSIPILLVYLARRKTDLVWNWFFTSFSIFIFCCGTSHVLDIVVMWQPVYGLAALVDVATAAASVMTALSLAALVPALEEALSRPSSLRVLLDDVNAELGKKVRDQEGKGQ